MPIIKIKNKLFIVTNIAIIVGLYILCCVLIKRTNINVGFIADNSFLMANVDVDEDS